MNFTDTFINKPVLAIVVSLLILVLGLRALSDISVRQYPKTENAVVTVLTAYYGADAQPIAGFITQPLEQAIAQAQGIDYLSSTSVTGLSTITATLRLNYDANRALTQIQTQVSSVRNQLPPQSQQPVLNVQVGETIDAMYMGFRSDVLPSNSITDYLARVVKPKLDATQGVQTAEIRGRHHQGADGQRRSHRRHRSALGRGIQAAQHQAEGRHDCASPGCRQRRAGRGRLQRQRVLQRQAGRLHRHQGGAGREHPRGRQAGARCDARDPGATAERALRRDRL